MAQTAALDTAQMARMLDDQIVSLQKVGSSASKLLTKLTGVFLVCLHRLFVPQISADFEKAVSRITLEAKWALNCQQNASFWLLEAVIATRKMLIAKPERLLGGFSEPAEEYFF